MSRATLPERALRATEQPSIAFMPAHTLVRHECLGDRWLINVGGRDAFGAATKKDRVILIRKPQGLLLPQLVARLTRVVCDGPRGRVVAEPLPHAGLGGARAIGRLPRGGGAGSGPC